VSFAAVTLCVASLSVFIFVAVYFVIDSVRKLLDMPSYTLFVCIVCKICRKSCPSERFTSESIEWVAIKFDVSN
jgi:ferredoxin